MYCINAFYMYTSSFEKPDSEKHNSGGFSNAIIFYS